MLKTDKPLKDNFAKYLTSTAVKSYILGFTLGALLSIIVSLVTILEYEHIVKKVW